MAIAKKGSRKAPGRTSARSFNVLRRGGRLELMRGVALNARPSTNAAVYELAREWDVTVSEAVRRLLERATRTGDRAG